MSFCEIIIGPPGSGKSTYVLEKSKRFNHRNLCLINLDPDNINKDFYNFNITGSLKNHQTKNDVGPNGSTKELLNNFVSNFNGFYYDNLMDKFDYFILDLPGQVEFFINNDSLNNMIHFLSSKNVNVVVINMIDLVFFNTSLLSSYLFTYTSVYLLEVPYVCVISKCDKYFDYGMKYSLEDLVSTNVLEKVLESDKENVDARIYNEENNFEESFKEEKIINKDTEFENDRKPSPSKKFEKIATEFLLNYFNQSFMILNYEDEKTVNILQLAIDRCSGYCYKDEFEEKETYYKNI